MTLARTILLVCTGNMCRSPMAEVILKDRLRRDHKDDLYHVRSAGTWTIDGRGASRLAIEAMQEAGLDLTGHRTHHLTSEDVHQAALILVMTQDHKDALLAEFPEAGRKMRLLSELVGSRHDILDPYDTGSLQLYRECANEITGLLSRGYDRILELAQGDSGGTSKD
jgi:protein-tyrosine-phosphatase